MTIEKLGFGLMRLPRKGVGANIDVEQVTQMVDQFLSAGFNYFDTAYVYNGSEEVIKSTLVDRYPRDKYLLATKLCPWMGCHDEESAKQQFYTSLERTQASYFDYYLLHSLQTTNYKIYDEYHLWDFVSELKEKGLVKHWGFSFHGSPEILDEVLTMNRDVEFVQLQLNYADWENPVIAARANYEVARKHGKQIVVMEPVKGGVLTNPPENVKRILKEANPDMSIPSWAIRYVASLEGVMTVLSGMSNLSQMQDNISYMKNLKPLNEDEQKVIAKAQTALSETKTIPCTACRYCTEGCPIHIDIPRIFAARNMLYTYGDKIGAMGNYFFAAAFGGKASDCIACGQCEYACPQHIDVISRLKECAEVFDI